MRQPQRHRAGDLDLHQMGVLRQELFTLGFALKADVVVPRGDLAVKGDPQLRVVVADQRDAVIADVSLGEEAIAADHVVDLDRDVADQIRGQLAGLDVAVGVVAGHRDPALVDNALVLFLDLKEDEAVFFGRAVGAEPQLFLVGGFFQRGLDQLVIRVVKVDVADVALIKAVGMHMRAEALHQVFVLLLRQHIFLFNSFEDVCESHVQLPFRMCRVFLSMVTVYGGCV